ncbi:hypothetical protein AAIB33_00845 [Microbacterium sp. AZCO]|uniref:hypothetical protein n=1 Tax=Microbacterium sp. AZCO TaxID=3142976 RepID=UPI0031F34635
MTERYSLSDRLALAAVVSLVALLPLAACSEPPVAPTDADAHARARGAVADISRGLYRGATDTIEDYARWADTDTKTSSVVELIGFESYPDTVHGEPFGALQFRATVPAMSSGDRYVACFESQFDYWGVATEKFGDWDNDAAVAHDVQCPPDAARIPPPLDTRPVYVVPDGAEALVVEVLTNASPTASADDIVAQVAARMPQPTGEREVAFEPHAVMAGGDIGFAMGDAHDCLLVKRSDDGVQMLSVPRVLLQPGELGCSPDTALRPLEQLQSPH